MDVELIKRKYRRNVRFYDLVRLPTARIRHRAVDRMRLRPGEIALDFGCGTGLSFEPLESAVGPTGRVIGVDVSPDMLARAREKIAAHGWTNVTAVDADAEHAMLAPESVDAVLCFYTHDIMQSHGALGGALAALRPGGRFVAAGAKLTSGVRGMLFNPVTAAYSFPAITNRDGLSRPWSVLENLLGALEVEEHLLRTAYVARGVKRGVTSDTVPVL